MALFSRGGQHTGPQAHNGVCFTAQAGIALCVYSSQMGEGCSPRCIPSPVSSPYHIFPTRFLAFSARHLENICNKCTRQSTFALVASTLLVLHYPQLIGATLALGVLVVSRIPVWNSSSAFGSFPRWVGARVGESLNFVFKDNRTVSKDSIVNQQLRRRVTSLDGSIRAYSPGGHLVSAYSLISHSRRAAGAPGSWPPAARTGGKRVSVYSKRRKWILSLSRTRARPCTPDFV